MFHTPRSWNSIQECPVHAALCQVLKQGSLMNVAALAAMLSVTAS